MFDELATEIHAWARDKGFYEREELLCSVEGNDYAVVNPSFSSEKVSLIHTEVSEVQEALRDGDSALEAEECADIIIRVLDYVAFREFSMDMEVAAKMEKNQGRPYKHGRKF